MREVTIKDDTVVLGGTWCTDSEGTLSDSDSLGVNESDSSYAELVSPPAKRRCSTRSEWSATRFAFC